MGDEDTDKTAKKSGGGVSAFTKLMATFGTALIMFFSGLVWRSYEKTNEALDTMVRRIEKLEEDKSKWGTLAELHNKTISIELEMSRQAGMMQGFILAVQGGMVEKPDLIIPLLPSKPSPSLKDPRELFKDSEDYRKLQQQKYPPPNVQQKK